MRVKGVLRRICEHQGPLKTRLHILVVSNWKMNSATKKRCVYNSHLFSQAALTVSIPWYRAVSGIRPETYPFVARGTKYAICFKFWYVRVGFEVVDAFFFCAFSTSSFCRRMCQSLCCTFWCINDGLSRCGSRCRRWWAFIIVISDETNDMR